MADKTVFDITIIGGGIVGAASMYQLQKKYPKLNLLLIEKEEHLFPLKKWLNNLIEIPQVISAYTLDRFKIKNQDYLIFE